MKYEFINPNSVKKKTKVRFKRSYDFMVYYFNNIMELGNDDLKWIPNIRVECMRLLIDSYRRSFKVEKYYDVQIWKHIKKLYWEYWDELHTDMLKQEKYV